MRKDTNEEEAVKVIKRPIPKLLKEMIANEIQIQAQLGEGHFNLVNAHEVGVEGFEAKGLGLNGLRPEGSEQRARGWKVGGVRAEGSAEG